MYCYTATTLKKTQPAAKLPFYVFVYVVDEQSCIMFNKEAPLSAVAKTLDSEITQHVHREQMLVGPRGT